MYKNDIGFPQRYSILHQKQNSFPQEYDSFPQERCVFWEKQELNIKKSHPKWSGFKIIIKIYYLIYLISKVIEPELSAPVVVSNATAPVTAVTFAIPLVPEAVTNAI